MNTIHKHCVVTLLLLITGGLAPALAAVPDGIDYQAYLTDSTGLAIDTDLSITFAAYNVAVGGAPLWVQTQSVTVDHGLFSVTLGNPVNPFPANLFDGPVYVGLIVDGEEMMPRRPLTSSAYSFKSADADTLTGVTATALNQAAHVVDIGNPHSVTAAQTGAATAADIAGLQSQLDAALATIASLQANVANLQTDVSGNSASIGTLQTGVSGNTANISSLQSDVAVIQGNTVLDLDNILTVSAGDTALFTGVNVQVVNGTGSTFSRNGVGNLIVGYNVADIFGNSICDFGEYDNELDCETNSGSWASVHHSGSHNVVVGDFHSYSHTSGLVVGYDNNITGSAASVSGGSENTAGGVSSSVGGGIRNIANSGSSSVSGGIENTASGFASSVSGGKSNMASGLWSSVSGGLSNTASVDYSSASGGWQNIASGVGSSVSGGRNNTASGLISSVSGGGYNTASGESAAVSGGGGGVASTGNLASGVRSSVSGGWQNVADGFNASVSGGRRNTASADTAWASGGDGNAASFPYTSISGGRQNTASGNYASVSGGRFNEASGVAAVVSGGGGDMAAEGNTASGAYSTVSGGENRTSTGESDWRAGSLFENF